MFKDDSALPPVRLRDLAQWQVGKAATLGSRLTALRFPLTGRSDFAVLATLTEFGAISQADIGRHLVLDRNDITVIVNRLQGLNLVSRSINPENRRSNTITITDAGTAHLAELQVLANDVQDQLLKGLDEVERVQLNVLLNKVLGIHGPQPG